MKPAAVVVIGASQGGVDALRWLVRKLDGRAPAVWCVVLHIGAHRSELPAILQRAGNLPAGHVRDGEALKQGHLYVAPPDCHFLLRNGHAALNRGPRENWARPAIDPLFRTAARAHGAQAIGVILTGNLNDGTAGLQAVKRAGGIAVVQDPADAVAPDMPASALRHVAVDHCVPLADMGSLLNRLVEESAWAGQVGVEEAVAMSEGYKLDQPVALSCPECSGTTRREVSSGLVQYRCHIGHVLTAEAMMEAQQRTLEHRLTSCLSLLNERAELLSQMIVTGEKGHDRERLQAAHAQCLERAERLRALLEAPWKNPFDGTGPVSPS